MAGYQLSVSGAVSDAMAYLSSNINFFFLVVGRSKLCSKNIIIFSNFIFILGRKKKGIKFLE
jgi:hypothetical protein